MPKAVFIFYGLDDDLRTGQVFYGRDLSEDRTIFYTYLLWIDWDIFIFLANFQICWTTLVLL